MWVLSCELLSLVGAASLQTVERSVREWCLFVVGRGVPVLEGEGVETMVPDGGHLLGE